MRWWWGLVVLVLGAAGGCSLPGGGGNGAAQTFVYSAGREALMVQWSPASSTGTMSQVMIDGSEQLQASSVGITVVVEGESVSLTPDLGTSWSGTLDGDELRLDVPKTAGGVSSVVLHRAEAAEFEAAAVTLRATASALQTMAQGEAEAAASEAALAEAEAAMAQDRRDIDAGMTSVRRARSELEPALVSARGALAAQRRLARAVPAGASCDVAEPALAEAEDAMGTFENEASGVDAAVDSVVFAAGDLAMAMRSFFEHAEEARAVGGSVDEDAVKTPVRAESKKTTDARVAAEKEVGSLRAVSADLEAEASEAESDCTY